MKPRKNTYVVPDAKRDRAMQILIIAAIGGTTVIYGELIKSLNTSRRYIGAILEAVNLHCVAIGVPPLTSLVVREHGGEVSGKYRSTSATPKMDREMCWQFFAGPRMIAVSKGGRW